MQKLWLSLLIVLLAGCASQGPKYTVDDGRAVNETLLGNIRSYGLGEVALRSAIVRSASLKSDCDTQWELPFAVATSYDASADDRVAWVRALGVDERLTVVASSPGSPLQLRDKIQEISGFSDRNTEKMVLELAYRRDAGLPFYVRLVDGAHITVQPFKVCQGYARLAPASTPKAQDYHWLLSIHPLEITRQPLTDDEALWVVLWGQGLSQEGALRMKAYHYSTRIAGALYNVFTIASGIKGAALAADAAMRAAQNAAASAATEILKRQLLEQASSMAAEKTRSGLSEAVQKLSQQQILGAMQQAASNRGSLTGMAWVAATVFDKADAWAYDGLEKLGANSLAGFSLHQKLLERGLTANSMVLDPERMKALNQVAVSRGRGNDVVAVLQGVQPDSLQWGLSEMPVASAQGAFSYEDAAEQAASSGQPFAHGLIDGLLSMPTASSNAR